MDPKQEGKRTVLPVVLAGTTAGLLTGLWLDRKWWQALVVGLSAAAATGAGIWGGDFLIQKIEERRSGGKSE